MFAGLGILVALLLVSLFTKQGYYYPIFGLAAWRWPFIFAGILVGIVGYYLRKMLPETPEFLALKAQQKLISSPLHTALNTERDAFLLSTVLSAFIGTAVYVLMVYLPSYLKQSLFLSEEMAVHVTMIIQSTMIIFILIFGSFCQKIGYRKLLFISTTIVCCIVFPCFIIINLTHDIVTITILLMLVMASIAAFDVAYVSYLPKLFTTNMRYSGVAVSANIGTAIIGGTAPFMLTWLKTYFHSAMLPAWYLFSFALCSLISLFIFRPRYA
jgi:MFS family permease